MRRVTGITLAALSATTVLGLTGLLGAALPAGPAGATTPQWKTTASFSPLANVRAVSCASSTSAATATCVAVGDDGGGHFASIIVTDDGGSVWTASSPPAGVTTLSAVSCPSASVCYAGGGDGIIKSSNGGASWVVQDSTFPAQSISCVTIDECTAVGGHQNQRPPMALPGIHRSPPSGTGLPVERFLSRTQLLVRRSESSTAGQRSLDTMMGPTGQHLPSQSSTSLITVSCSDATTCMAVGVAAGGGAYISDTTELFGVDSNELDP